MAVTRKSAVDASAAAVLFYESAALASHGRLPSITAICTRFPWLAPLAVAGLTLHLYLAARAPRFEP